MVQKGQKKIEALFDTGAEFACLKNLDFDVIIGVEIMQPLGLILDMSTDKILL